MFDSINALGATALCIPSSPGDAILSNTDSIHLPVDLLSYWPRIIPTFLMKFPFSMVPNSCIC